MARYPRLSRPRLPRRFLAHAPFANDFYIVDRNGAIGENVGRIVRVDASGEAGNSHAEPVPGDWRVTRPR